MQHPYKALQAEYAADIAHMQITRPHEVDSAAKEILQPQNIDRYVAACEGTEVPPAFIGALDLRESSCNPRLGLGQGDPWSRVSTHVPRGFGPFKSWAAAASFYIHYDHLDDNSHPWSVEYACWKGEGWNGWGVRAHGRATGYLWAGSSIYMGGKYVADGKWDPNYKDTQLGIMPVILRIGQLRPDLAVGSSLPNVPAPPTVPNVNVLDSQVVEGINSHADIWYLQTALNVLGAVPQLDVDGNFGRETRRAVWAYQAAHHLHVDGLVGPETADSIKGELKTRGIKDQDWRKPATEVAA